MADDFVGIRECWLLMKEYFDGFHVATVSAFAPSMFILVLLLILF
jgi:hypothetical protein